MHQYLSEGQNSFIFFKWNMVPFWKDPWLHNIPLHVSYPMLFNITMVQDITFAEVCN
jgi:hypothetical protein